MAVQHSGVIMQRTLMITGASSGIGLATAALFQQKKYRVINLSRTPCDLPEVLNFCVDLSQSEEVQSFIEELPKLFERQEAITLVHNASPYLQDSVLSYDPKKMSQAFAIGIIAPSLLNQALIPYMKDDSSLLFIGSTLSEKAVPGCMSYVALKHSLVGLMRSCAQDLALHEKKIHTACICPGFTETNMLNKHVDREVLEKIVKEKVILKRLIQPEEIANFILFCSQNPLINGSVLHGNLGQIEN